MTRRHLRLAASLALAAALAPWTPTPWTQAAAAGPHDGTWKGTYRTIRNDNSGRCDKLDDSNVTIQVADGKFTRRWAGNDVEVTVAPDGTVAGSAVRAQGASGRGQTSITFAGRIVDGVMQGEYGHARCAVAFSLRRQ